MNEGCGKKKRLLTASCKAGSVCFDETCFTRVFGFSIAIDRLSESLSNFGST